MHWLKNGMIFEKNVLLKGGEISAPFPLAKQIVSIRKIYCFAESIKFISFKFTYLTFKTLKNCNAFLLDRFHFVQLCSC